MARRSESGYHHVTMRGNGRQVIFENDRQRLAFLDALKNACDTRGIAIRAWCLMPNHVHLLLEDEKESLSEAMQALQIRYAKLFNAQTGHVGHVFEGRFKSSPIEDEDYLLQAARYIHNNPEKAGIAPHETYYWSSYREYVGRPTITKTDILLELTGGLEGFKTFSSAESTGTYWRRGQGRVSPEDERDCMIHAIRKAGAVPSISIDDIKTLPLKQRERILDAASVNGLSARQIERLTGIGRKTIARIIASQK